MDNTKTHKTDGPALATAFSFLSLYISFNPDLFGNKIAWNIILGISIFISIIGICSEISNFLKDKYINANNLITGIITGIFYFLQRKFIHINNVPVKFIFDLFFIFVLLVAIYLILNNLYLYLKLFSIDGNLKDRKMISIKTIGTFIISLTSFLASLVAILQAFGLLDNF